MKPIKIPDDKSILTVEIYWLGDSISEFKDSCTPLLNLIQPATGLGCSIVRQTMRCIRSSDKLTFTTKDAKGWPHPSMPLLHMKWVLNRHIALTGAADVTDEELDPDNPIGLARLILVGDLMEAEEEDKKEEGVGHRSLGILYD
ncbi:hypothetical protein BJX76DRAFT_362169 [Aspergillus varians]